MMLQEAQRQPITEKKETDADARVGEVVAEDQAKMIAAA